MNSAWKVSANEYPKNSAIRDQLRFLLHYAILAPSSHNAQPWLFRVAGDSVELLADRSRALPVTDPDDRELTISCGAALYLLRLAMRKFGLADEVHVLPGGEASDVFAHVSVGGSHSTTEDEHILFAAIPDRHTNRQPFHQTPIPNDLAAQWINDVISEGAWLHRVYDGEQKHAVAELVAEGDFLQASDKRFRRELAAWLHSNRSRSGDGIPGYALGMSDIASYLGPFMVRTFDWGEGQAAKDQQLAEGSPLLMVIGTREDTTQEWLRAGQALARMLLRATSAGVHASYLNQPIEVEQLRPQLTELVKAEGFPQLLLRMGYGQPTSSTPRRPVEEMILN